MRLPVCLQSSLRQGSSVLGSARIRDKVPIRIFVPENAKRTTKTKSTRRRWPIHHDNYNDDNDDDENAVPTASDRRQTVPSSTQRRAQREAHRRRREERADFQELRAFMHYACAAHLWAQTFAIRERPNASDAHACALLKRVRTKRTRAHDRISKAVDIYTRTRPMPVHTRASVLDAVVGLTV